MKNIEPWQVYLTFNKKAKRGFTVSFRVTVLAIILILITFLVSSFPLEF